MVHLIKNSPEMRETWVQSLGWEDPLEKGNATHSSILAWRIPWGTWTVQSMGSLTDQKYSVHIRDYYYCCCCYCYLCFADEDTQV